jgi:exosortase
VTGLHETGTRSDERAAPWLAIACFAAALGAIAPALRVLSYIWSNTDFMGYGYLIPASALALSWLRRHEISGALRSAAPPANGAAWVLGAALVESVGLLSDVGSLAGIGIPLLLGATAYAVGGTRLARVLALPVGFLVFMIPPPGFLVDPMLETLKTWVTWTAVAILQHAGFLVASEGNRIFLPGHELFVANACAGLNSIVTLLPLGVVVATFLLRGAGRRALLLASVVPLAMIGNIARVVVTALLVTRFGIEYAEGNLHETFGVATFALGAAALLGVARLLR